MQPNLNKDKPQLIRDRKERVVEKVKHLLKEIQKDNPDIFKKEPEGRTKEIESIINKAKKNPKVTTDNIEEFVDDIAGTRVICCTSDEISIVENLIKSHNEVQSCHVVKKWSEGADDEGYRAQHLQIAIDLVYQNKTIKETCEVQIRTLASDLWAVLSHRDFYKSSDQPDDAVKKDMVTLSKILEVVDDLAVNLKDRRREDIESRAKELQTGKKQKDYLIEENVKKMVKAALGLTIGSEKAYDIIAYCLRQKVTSITELRDIIRRKSTYRQHILDEFSRNSVEPEIDDLIKGPIYLKSKGLKLGLEKLQERIAVLRKSSQLRTPEKGVEISAEKLQMQKKTQATPEAPIA